MDMEGVFAALVMAVSFSLLNALWKQLRNKGVDSSALLALLGFGVPIWLVIGVYLLRTHSPNLSFLYITLVVFWTLIILCSNFLHVYVIRYGGLTELSAYGSTFSILVALSVDIFWFNILPEIFTYTAIGCFFVAGLILSQNRGNLVKKELKMDLRKVLPLLLTTSLLYTLGFAVYKEGISYQSTILFHLVIMQTALHTSWFFIGMKPLFSNIKKGLITPKFILISLTLLVTGVFGELYALRELPVTIMVLIGIISPAIFTLFDIRKKEMNFTPLSIGALILIVSGFVFLHLT